MKTTDSALASQLGYDPAYRFGPLWKTPTNVLTCLRRYIASEGHRGLVGQTVRRAAEICLFNDPYAGTGEEYRAMACLLRLGAGDMVI